MTKLELYGILRILDKEVQMEIKNEISKQIWSDRYQLGDESIDDNIRRVARKVATNEDEQREFEAIMSEGLFFPAGRTMCNAGRSEKLTFNNCFTIGSIPDSMEGIFESVKIGALTQKAGGGTGYDFSNVRPSGSRTSNDAIASGVVSFIEPFDAQTKTVLQGGRRGK